MAGYRLKSILVPTDFSSISKHGLQHALRIAKLTRARITLLDIVERFGGGFGTSGMLGMADQLQKKQRELCTRRLERIARAAEKHLKVPVTVVVVVGRVAETITGIAKQT